MILDFFKRRRRRQIAWSEGRDEGLRAMRASVGRALGLEPDGVNNKGEGVWRYSSILDAIDQLREVEQRACDRAYRAECTADALHTCINSIAEKLGFGGHVPIEVVEQAVRQTVDLLGEMEDQADRDPAPTMPLTEDGERVLPGETYYAVGDEIHPQDRPVAPVRYLGREWDGGGRVWAGIYPVGSLIARYENVKVFYDKSLAEVVAEEEGYNHD